MLVGSLVIGSLTYAGTAALDQSFGTGGLVTTDVGGQGSIEALEVSFGGLVVAGGSDGSQAVLDCYTPGGVLDTSFGGVSGTHGLVRPHPGSIQRIVRQNDGRLVTAGGGPGFRLARYSSGGENEIVVSPLTSAGLSSPFWAYDMVARGDGSLIVLGDGYASGCALLGFASTLAPDLGFGSAANGEAPLQTCRSLARDPASGQLFVAAAHTPSGADGFGLARFTSTGALDTAFGAGGVSFAPGTDSAELPRGMARQADGKLLVVGSAGLGSAISPKTALVTRFNADGTLDGGFGRGAGVVAFGDSTGTIAFTAQAVVVQDDGRIIVGGNATGPSDVRDGAGPSAFVIIRFLPDGEFDVAFGDDPTGTLAITPWGQGVSAELHTTVLQPDGKLLVAGWAATGHGGQRQFAVARYDVSGASVAGNPGGVDVGGGGGGSGGGPAGGNSGAGSGGGNGGGATPCSGTGGLESFRCVCARGVGVASCVGQKVPAGVGNDLRKACTFVDRAVANTRKAKQRTFFRRASAQLRSAAAIVRRNASHKRLKGDCPGDLEAVLSNGQNLVGVIRSGR